jgi:hypothetical protein
MPRRRVVRSLAALGLLALLALPGTAQAQLCGSGAPALYTVNGSNLTNTYGRTGCYWVPASNNAALQPQLYPSQQQPTTSSLAGFGNAGPAGWYLYPPGLGPSQAGPLAPSGYSAGGASVVPGSGYPTVAGAPISPWQYPSFVWSGASNLRVGLPPYWPSLAEPVEGGPLAPAATVPALGALPAPTAPTLGSLVAPAASSAPATTTGTLSAPSNPGPSTAPPIPGRGGGNYIGDDPDQRGTVTVVRP